jgi:AcrR family transcriptional regulator
MPPARGARPPSQARSRRTREQILEAAETLLGQTPFEQITIADIVAHASCSTGAFYGRFAGKEDLLPALYERYDDGLEESIGPIFERIAAEQPDLPALCRAYVTTLTRHFRGREFLFRALGLYVRAHPEMLSRERIGRRAAMHQRVVTLFEPHHDAIPFADPAERVRLGLYFVSAVMRDKVLFGGAPHARSTPMTDEQLGDHLAELLFTYLTMPVPSQEP